MEKLVFTGRRKAVAITLMLLLVGGLIFFPTIVNASTKEATSYESIQIDKGDTLWSLAEEYRSDNISTNDFVKEIKDINGLSSDYINEGNYLIIPIYE